MTNTQNHQIALFKGKEVRKIIYKKEWWFSILDIVGILTDSPQPKTYWAKMKKRDESLSQPFPFWEQLKMPAEDGKMRETDCANTEGVLRIVQSIPSPKAEPLKRWLAKVGYERMQEIENPELATKSLFTTFFLIPFRSILAANRPDFVSIISLCFLNRYDFRSKSNKMALEKR